MTRNLKVLGLALVAALAMSAMAASAASANEPFQFHSDGSPTILDGTGTGDVFETDGGKTTCSSTTYHGELTSQTTTTVSLKPTYSGCTLSPFGSAVVDVNGCEYVFHAEVRTTTAGTESQKYHVQTTIVCPPGKEITVTASLFGTNKCTVHIPPQDLGTGIALTDTATDDLIEADISFSSITYTQTAGTGFGACSNGNDTSNGKYTGEADITGTDANGQPTHIWLGPDVL